MKVVKVNSIISIGKKFFKVLKDATLVAAPAPESAPKYNLVDGECISVNGKHYSLFGYSLKAEH